MDDYRTLGVMAALDAVRRIVPDQKVHARRLLPRRHAARDRRGRDGARRRRAALKSVTLLAAQTDFTEAGELMLFINESQLAFLEDMMWEQGFLDSRQMAGAFQMLRSNDLIWSRMVRDYLMGERAADDRPHGLERRCHAHALSHAFRISAPALPRQRSCGRPLHGRREAGRAHRHSRCRSLPSAPCATTSRHGARSTRSTC